MEKLKCDYCGKPIYRNQTLLNKCNHYYCSKECADKGFIKRNEYELFDDHAEIIINSKVFGEQRVLIDIEDIDRCKLQTWKFINRTSPYIISSEKILLHRYILDYKGKNVIDHLDGNKLNNQKNNLLICSQWKNCQNRKTTQNRSGCIGVFYHKQYKKWWAYISYQGKRENLGYFKDYEQAVKVRKDAEKKYYGHEL